MTALEQLNVYLRRLESRFRLLAASRGIAAMAALAFGLTLLLVWIANRYQFAEQIVLPLRILLFFAIAAAAAFALAIPFARANRRRLTRLAERRVPEFEQRLLTAERQDPANPFSELIAEDALRIARDHQPEEFAPSAFLYGFTGTAAAAIAVLAWLIAAGPGFWGYGASLLWTGNASASRRPIYDITVQPGNRTVRRKSDQAITAHLLGFSAPAVLLHARYDGALKWEAIPMQTQPGGNGYRFLFAGLSDGVEYYVQAGARESKHFRLAVKDLPAVKRIRVTLHFPSALGLQDVTADPGGDIRAVQGSQADISVLTDKPLEHGALELQNGSQIPLRRAANGWLTARMPVEKDGSYHVAALQGSDAVRISDDYFIEAKPDEPPTVAIVRPGRDTHVSPIEELPVAISASDDFGVEALDLHYSVNGGAEQTVPLLKQKGVRQTEGRTTLYLENFKLVPGDIVSFYATARDVKATSRSDIFFAQAEPFDLKFTQSQQSAGMGAAGDQAADVIERQKQIIAATYNELKQQAKSRAAVNEDARSLTQAQSKLSDQEKTLAARMSDRDLTDASSQLGEMSKLMTEAASQMDGAANELKSAKWKTALPPEEKAFQSLNRIDAMYRDFQIAFGQRGGAGMNGAQRDLARMFDLEMDMSKNQYETGQSADQSAGDQQKAIDKAFERLQALAHRQQELAAEHRDQKAFEQRWQEEQLRREAEELRRQMQQMTDGSQSGQRSDSQSGQQSASSSSRQSGQMSRGEGQDQQMAQAMRQAAQALQQAEQEMGKAANGNDAGAEQRAAEQLARAQNALNQALQQQAGSALADLNRRAQELAQAQRHVANRMKQMYGPPMGMYPSGRDTARNNQGSGASGGVPMPQMTDPIDPIPYGYGNSWFRRRYLQQLAPPHMPSPEERGVASAKDQLARQVEQLQKQLQQQVQNLGATQPDAAAKLRKALSALEEEDLAMRMRKNAEWMREGYGDRNLSTEDSITQGLEQLNRDLAQAQQAIRSGANGRNGQSDQAEQALNDLRSLREQMQHSQQPGGQGNQAGPQPGNEQAENGTWGPYGGGGPGIDRNDLKAAITDLNRLRAQVKPNDHSYRYLDYTLGYLVHLYHADPNVLRAAINEDAVANLERLELELNQRVNNRGIEGARTGAPEVAPQKYRNAVADYFKKLSQ
jgi:hypothetical protein